jgi:hypothetical protein
VPLERGVQLRRQVPGRGHGACLEPAGEQDHGLRRDVAGGHDPQPRRAGRRPLPRWREHPRLAAVVDDGDGRDVVVTPAVAPAMRCADQAGGVRDGDDAAGHERARLGHEGRDGGRERHATPPGERG